MPKAAFMAGQAKNARSIAYSETLSPTLKGSPSGLNQMPCICEPTVYGICSDKSNSMLSSNPNSGIYKAETSRTLGQNCGNPGCNQGGMVIVEPQPARIFSIPGDSLPYGGCGQNNVEAPAITMRLREGCAGGGKGPLIQNEKSGTLATGNDQYLFCTARNAVAAIDCRNLYESDISGTLQSKCTGGYSLNYQNPVRIGYIVRRLTPMEAERLMSLPDSWTEYGHDDKLMSDSARYQMCGNSIVVNCLAYIMQNIAEYLRPTGLARCRSAIQPSRKYDG